MALKQTLKAEIEAFRPRTPLLVKEFGKVVIDQVTIDQAIGACMGVIAGDMLGGLLKHTGSMKFYSFNFMKKYRFNFMRASGVAKVFVRSLTPRGREIGASRATTPAATMPAAMIGTADAVPAPEEPVHRRPRGPGPRILPRRGSSGRRPWDRIALVQEAISIEGRDIHRTSGTPAPERATDRRGWQTIGRLQKLSSR